MVATSLAMLGAAAGVTLEAALKHAPAALMKFNVSGPADKTDTLFIECHCGHDQRASCSRALIQRALGAAAAAALCRMTHVVWTSSCTLLQPIVVEKGLGAWVWDTNGDKYLDMTTGACSASSCAGQHPAVVRASTQHLGAPRTRQPLRVCLCVPFFGPCRPQSWGL